jgi:hypothetical protein
MKDCWQKSLRVDFAVLVEQQRVVGLEQLGEEALRLVVVVGA